MKSEKVYVICVKPAGEVAPWRFVNEYMRSTREVEGVLLHMSGPGLSGTSHVEGPGGLADWRVMELELQEGGGLRVTNHSMHGDGSVGYTPDVQRSLEVLRKLWEAIDNVPEKVLKQLAEHIDLETIAEVKLALGSKAPAPPAPKPQLVCEDIQHGRTCIQAHASDDLRNKVIIDEPYKLCLPCQANYYAGRLEDTLRTIEARERPAAAEPVPPTSKVIPFVPLLAVLEDEPSINLASTLKADTKRADFFFERLSQLLSAGADALKQACMLLRADGIVPEYRDRMTLITGVLWILSAEPEAAGR